MVIAVASSHRHRSQQHRRLRSRAHRGGAEGQFVIDPTGPPWCVPSAHASPHPHPPSFAHSRSPGCSSPPRPPSFTLDPNTGVSGAEHIAEALKVNSSLTQLNLYGASHPRTHLLIRIRPRPPTRVLVDAHRRRIVSSSS